MRSRGPDGPNHYQELKNEDEELRRKSEQAADQAQVDIDYRERRWEEFERSIATEQQAIDQQREETRITGHEAAWKRERADANAAQSLISQEAEDARRKIEGDLAARLAEEHAGILAQQAADMASIRQRFDATKEEVLSRPSQFGTEGSRFIHERERHDKALSQQFGGADPLAAERRAAGTEFSLFIKEQERYEQRILSETDLTTRHDLAMEKNIRAADHIAFTAHRIADQSEAITGDAQNEITENYRNRADEYQKASDELRREHDELRLNYKGRWSDAAWSNAEGPLSGSGMSDDKEARFAAFESETQSTQSSQSRTRGRGGLD